MTQLSNQDSNVVPPQKLTSAADYNALLDRYDTFLLDCDGVIWAGPNLIPKVKVVLDLLRSKGKNILFVTNNASKSRAMYKSTFDGFGIRASVDEIFGSGYAAAIYLSKILKFPKDKRVYVIGEKGLEDELDSVGISHAGGTDPEDNVFLPSKDFSSIGSDPSIGAVLCGFDMRINYKKYGKAHTYIMNNPGCHFIITNADATFPNGDAFYPGSGAMSAPLRYSTKKEPTVIGKPHSHMMDTIMASHEFDPKRTLMVGDNLETDILFGKNSGVSTMLVMTGVTSEAVLEASTTRPDYIIASLGDLSVLAEKASQ